VSQVAHGGRKARMVLSRCRPRNPPDSSPVMLTPENIQQPKERLWLHSLGCRSRPATGGEGKTSSFVALGGSPIGPKRIGIVGVRLDPSDEGVAPIIRLAFAGPRSGLRPRAWSGMIREEPRAVERRRAAAANSPLTCGRCVGARQRSLPDAQAGDVGDRLVKRGREPEPFWRCAGGPERSRNRPRLCANC
jgi:hypothetical protein